MDTKINIWQEVYGYCTPGGDPVWACPNCRGSEHVYGIEHAENYTHECRNCGQMNYYPWEKYALLKLTSEKNK